MRRRPLSGKRCESSRLFARARCACSLRSLGSSRNRLSHCGGRNLALSDRLESMISCSTTTSTRIDSIVTRAQLASTHARTQPADSGRGRRQWQQSKRQQSAADNCHCDCDCDNALPHTSRRAERLAAPSERASERRASDQSSSRRRRRCRPLCNVARVRSHFGSFGCAPEVRRVASGTTLRLYLLPAARLRRRPMIERAIVAMRLFIKRAAKLN